MVAIYTLHRTMAAPGQHKQGPRPLLGTKLLQVVLGSTWQPVFPEVTFIRQVTMEARGLPKLVAVPAVIILLPQAVQGSIWWLVVAIL
jgi:hypothetical protein